MNNNSNGGAITRCEILIFKKWMNILSWSAQEWKNLGMPQRDWKSLNMPQRVCESLNLLEKEQKNLNMLQKKWKLQQKKEW
jgi:hypothetical protein